MKLDNFLRIEPMTVYRGRTPVLKEEIRRLYGSSQVSVVDLNIFSEKNSFARIRQFLDMFALPEMTLLCDCTQYLMDQEIPFDHEYLASDVEFVIRKLHTSYAIHEEILSDKERYILPKGNIGNYFNRLKLAGKKLFVVTNSKFSFVDQCMRHIIGNDWRDLFDVVVVRSRKPTFFTEANRPFRSQHPHSDTPTWRKIMKFEHGGVYQEGNADQLMKLTGWHGANVLYIGDHVYTDLADPVMKNGWRTGAIIPELEREIQVSSSLEYQRTRRWLLTLEKLIEQLQYESNGEMSDTLQSWLQEKVELRRKMKLSFNPRFGSIFRTHQNPTYFSWRLARFADIYMSSLENLNNYSLNHKFHPHRAALPHELHIGLD
jgi:HAD superfamily 5'-nucleotidase-like hydrolase